MKSIYKDMNIIGSDETGVGDYLTPLVACAVFVPFQNVSKLESLGVTDSKKLSDKQIVEIANNIKPLDKYRVKHLTPSGYNKLNKSYNANELKMFLHMGAINDLEESIDKADLIIIDQFSTEASIKKYYKRLGESTFGFKQFKAKLKLVEKGEMEHVSVAAGSIIARATFVELMKKQNEKWGMKFPLGTNAIVESFAKDFVAKHGIDSLKEVAKLSFKTTEKLFGKISND